MFERYLEELFIILRKLYHAQTEAERDLLIPEFRRVQMRVQHESETAREGGNNAEANKLSALAHEIYLFEQFIMENPLRV